MKALMAFEPFHQDSARVRGMYRLLTQIGGSDAVDVAFVVTRTENTLNLALNVPLEERYTTYPRKLIRASFMKAKMAVPDRAIHVIDSPTFSTTKAVDDLLALAARKKAGLIGLFTHAREGYRRFVLGSFAETAIHRSKASLLICNPQTAFPAKVRRILFASDFSASTSRELKEVFRLCKTLGAGLTIFHAAEMIYQWSLDESNPDVRAYRQHVNRQKTAIEARCTRAGIACDIQVTSNFARPSDEVMRIAAKARADLIIVAAKSGRVTALMGGSVTRHIVRSSQKPVLVLKT